jgi:hypothetical protein
VADRRPDGPSAEAEECALTELPFAQCACRQHRGGHAPGEEPVEPVGQVFAASYDGPCARHCEQGVREGDQIARVADGPGYVHAGSCP